MTTPMSADYDAENDVLIAAVSIARSAPMKQNPSVAKAQIPWNIIHDLRAALDGLEIDWRDGR